MGKSAKFKKHESNPLNMPQKSQMVHVVSDSKTGLNETISPLPDGASPIPLNPDGTPITPFTKDSSGVDPENPFGMRPPLPPKVSLNISIDNFTADLHSDMVINGDDEINPIPDVVTPIDGVAGLKQISVDLDVPRNIKKLSCASFDEDEDEIDNGNELDRGESADLFSEHASDDDFILSGINTFGGDYGAGNKSIVRYDESKHDLEDDENDVLAGVNTLGGGDNLEGVDLAEPEDNNNNEIDAAGKALPMVKGATDDGGALPDTPV